MVHADLFQNWAYANIAIFLRYHYKRIKKNFFGKLENIFCLLFLMQGPDPSLAYRPNLEKDETKGKEEYRNFEVSIQLFLSPEGTSKIIFIT